MKNQDSLFSFLLNQPLSFYIQNLCVYSQIPRIGLLFKKNDIFNDSKNIKRFEECFNLHLQRQDFADAFWELIFHLASAFEIKQFQFDSFSDFESFMNQLESLILKYAADLFSEPIHDWNTLCQLFSKKVRLVFENEYTDFYQISKPVRESIINQISDYLKKASSQQHSRLKEKWETDQLDHVILHQKWKEGLLFHDIHEIFGDFQETRILSQIKFFNDRPNLIQMIKPHMVFSGITAILVMFSSIFFGLFISWLGSGMIMKNQKKNFDKGLWFNLLLSNLFVVDKESSEMNAIELFQYYQKMTQTMNQFVDHYHVLMKSKRSLEKQLIQYKKGLPKLIKDMENLKTEVEKWIDANMMNISSPEALSEISKIDGFHEQVAKLDELRSYLILDEEYSPDPYRKRAQAVGSEIGLHLNRENYFNLMKGLLRDLLYEGQSGVLKAYYEEIDLMLVNRWVSKIYDLRKNITEIDIKIENITNEITICHQDIIEVRLKIRRRKDNWPGFTEYFKQKL